MEMIDELENIDLTPRLVTSVLASQYDPLGLNSSRTIHYKVLLKDTNLVVKEWDKLLMRSYLKSGRQLWKRWYIQKL